MKMNLRTALCLGSTVLALSQSSALASNLNFASSLQTLPLETSTLFQQETLSSAESDFNFVNGTITDYRGQGGHVVIPSTINGETVHSVGDFAFNHATSVLSITMPDTITTVGMQSFQGCTSMSFIRFSSNLHTIGSTAFNSCSSLTSLDLPTSLVNLGGAAFMNCTGLSTVVIPDSVTSIGHMAFQDCTGLTSVKLSNAITTYSQQVFQNCDNITTLTVPEGVREIQSCAFQHMTGLKTLYLPSSVISIEQQAFNGCTALETIYFGGSLSQKNQMYLVPILNTPMTTATWVYAVDDTTTTPYSVNPYTSDYVKPTALTMKRPYITRVGEYYPVDVSAYPDNATYREITWSVPDTTTGVTMNGNVFHSTEPGEKVVYLEIKNPLTGLPFLRSNFTIEVLPQEDSNPGTLSSGGSGVFALPTINQGEALATPGVSSSLEGVQNYGVQSSSKTGSLVETSSGYSRIEAITEENPRVVIEEYNRNFQITDVHSIPTNWGSYVAFHEGANHYYLMYSQTNPQENDWVEVVRVVKYDKYWNEISKVSLNYLNTKSGVTYAHMAEVDGVLLVHTRHGMYASSDGLSHQANLRFSVDIASMTLLTQDSDVGGLGYCSHSFNQLVAVAEDGGVYSADHGDAYPRAMLLCAWKEPYSPSGIWYNGPQEAEVLQISGTTGANTTKARFGGLVAGSEVVMLAGSSVTQNASYASNKDYNIFLTITPRSDFSTENSQILWLTNYDGTNSYASNPYLLEMGGDRYVLLWNELSGNGTVLGLYWVYFDGTGKQVGDIQRTEGNMSNVTPLVTESGDILWYSTNNSAPVFYRLALSSNTMTVVDSLSVLGSALPSDHQGTLENPLVSPWASTIVDSARNQGLLLDSLGTNYQTDITREQIAELLVNMVEKYTNTTLPETSSDTFTDSSNPMVLKAVATGMVNGRGGGIFAPNDTATREDVATMMYQALKVMEAYTNKTLAVEDTNLSGYSDFDLVSEYAKNPMAVLVNNDLMSGMSDTILSPKTSTTIEQCVAMVHTLFLR